MPQKDMFGKALLDFQNQNYSEDIITWTNISDEDELPLSYLFRSYEKMPKIEKMALAACKEKVLDVGCGAGSHSLYLQNQKFDVTAIDISEGAVDVAKNRGVKKVRLQHLLEVKDKFDTFLLLMNGSGIFKNIANLPVYLNHLKSILNPKGQILIDSSDIAYMYENEENVDWKNSDSYYGELDYYLSYKGELEEPLQWLYLDFDTLKTCSEALGFKCTKLVEGDHFDYLAKLESK